MTPKDIAAKAVSAFHAHATNKGQNLTGLSADVRRWKVGRPLPLSAVAFAVEAGLDVDEIASHGELIVTALAIAARLADCTSQATQTVGESLYNSGLSEQRLQRLLDAQGERLSSLMVKVARTLAAKRTSINTNRFLDLLFQPNDTKHRLMIAGTYLRKKNATENSNA
jgi:hypothetical protein